MTFSYSVPEWTEAQRLYHAQRFRWLRVFGVLPPAGFVVCLVLFVLDRSWFGFGCVCFTGAIVADMVLFTNRRFEKRLATKFQRIYNADRTPPTAIGFSAQGVAFKTKEGNTLLPWDEVRGVTEGKQVWMLRPRKRQKALLCVPKSALQNPENAREWALVEARFAKPVAPPIALPHG